mgnify:CR=1 FL=1
MTWWVWPPPLTINDAIAALLRALTGMLVTVILVRLCASKNGQFRRAIIGVFAGWAWFSLLFLAATAEQFLLGWSYGAGFRAWLLTHVWVAWAGPSVSLGWMYLVVRHDRRRRRAEAARAQSPVSGESQSGTAA